MMHDIENRADIRRLMDAFYAKIRKDAMLGPIFNSHIPEEKWPAHLEKLTDFWETNLFGIPKFKGNPTGRHIAVDRNLNHTISPVHFGQWLNIWFETINEMFSGERADRAKNAARKMSTGQYIAIWSNRPEEMKN